MSVTVFMADGANRTAEGGAKLAFNYGARLAATILFLPAPVMVLTAAFFVFKPGPLALVFGIAAGVVSWLIAAAFCNLVEAEHGIPTSYAELRQRLTSMEAKLLALDDDAAGVREAVAHVEEIGRALRTTGPQWASGLGYNAVWTRFHRAEQALFDVASLEELLEGAHYDDLRLQNSDIPNRDALREMLRKAEESVAKGGSLDRARGEFRDVRRSINEYRDQLWAGLIVARNRLLSACSLTSAVAFAILATTIATSTNKDPVVSALLLYLIGAAVGLGQRLRTDSQASSALIDEGLAAARLVTIPVFSGLAAVFGVALAAALPNASPCKFENVFVIAPSTCVVAAIFGLTPGLVFDTLKSKTEKFKKDLTSSQATGQS